MPAPATRDRILASAAELFRRQGFEATGLSAVLRASGAPKGVLYFHFPGGKEQLGAEAVALSGGDLRETLADAAVGAADAADGIRRIGQLLADRLEASGYAEGCPIATVALEQATESEPIRGACAVTYSSWLQGLATALTSWGVPAAEAMSKATLVLSSLQGALLLARVHRDRSIVDTVTEQLADGFRRRRR